MQSNDLTVACVLLAPELWDLIVLDRDINFADLCRLGATCTRFRDLVAVMQVMRHTWTQLTALPLVANVGRQATPPSRLPNFASNHRRHAHPAAPFPLHPFLTSPAPLSPIDLRDLLQDADTALRAL